MQMKTVGSCLLEYDKTSDEQRNRFENVMGQQKIFCPVAVNCCTNMWCILDEMVQE
jgi:hypothetical protein